VSDDSRAGTSNFGTYVDIFAPGVSIISAKTNTISGTSASYSGASMASPHVAGVAALLLEECRGITPGQLLQKMLDSAIFGVVGDPGIGSPNKLLYTGDIAGPAAPSTALSAAPSPAPAPAPVCKAKREP
jgi:subtilisin family serine protease